MSATSPENSKDPGDGKQKDAAQDTEGRRQGFKRRVCGAWRAEVDGRIGELRGRAAVVRGGRRAPEGKARKKEDRAWGPVVKAVDASLESAEEAIGRSGPLRHPWRNFCAWWSGSAITTAWESVHIAELALLSVERDDDVAVTVPRLLSWIERTMDNGPQRKAHEATLKEVMEDFPRDGREKVRAALADVIEANGNRYANVRAFRNNLILIMLALLIGVVGVSTWHALNTNFLSLCTETSGGVLMHCLGGKDSKPQGADVAMVAAMGALGGLLAIAFSFTETEIAPTRYDPKTWQAFLKPVTGAAVAIIAVLFLQSGFLVQPSKETQATFLAYAVLFGFSQQLFTHFVDKKADALITPDRKNES